MLGTLVRETATAPGTGTTVTLTGATAGRRTFVSEFGSAASCFYFITDGTQTEAQIGTVSAGPPATLTRGTPVWTSAAGATSPTRLNFTAAVVVYAQLPGQRAVYTDNAGALQGITAAKLRESAGATTVGAAVLTAASAAAARTAIGAQESGALVQAPGVVVTGAAATSRYIDFRTSAANRFNIFVNGDAETGSNAGSNLEMSAWNDAGSVIGQVFTVARATRVLDFKVAPTLNGGPLGRYIQRAYAEYTTRALISTALPTDDTVPLSTEGVQILSASITPSSASNSLRVRFQGFGSVSAGGNTPESAWAMFSGTTCIAAGLAIPTFGSGGTGGVVFVGEVEFVPGSTSALTISVRVGDAIGSAANLYMNGDPSGRLFGGVARSTLVVEELQS